MRAAVSPLKAPNNQSHLYLCSVSKFIRIGILSAPSFFFQGDWVLTYLYRMHAIRLLCAGKLMLVSSCKTTQVVLDAPQVEKRIYVIDSAPHFPLLVVHRMHYLMHLPIPPVFRVIPAVRLKNSVSQEVG
jgi:hypothetical protein